jgi:hypothetical protein
MYDAHGDEKEGAKEQKDKGFPPGVGLFGRVGGLQL